MDESSEPSGAATKAEAMTPKRRIRMTRLVLALALLGTMLAGGWFQPASAGTGSSATCNNGYGEAPGHIEIPLIAQPITLALEIPDPTQGQPINHVRLCYSTSKSGYGGPDTTGGSITVYPDSYWNSVRCSPQGNMGNVAPVSCYASPRWGAEVGMAGVAYAAAVPTYTVNPTAHNFGSGNHTVSFSIPVTLCQSQCYCLNVGFCDDSGTRATRVSLGTTGVIQGLVDVGRTTDLNDGNPYWYDGTGVMVQAPPGTTGVGAKGVLLWYCADGGCQPLTTPLDLAAGVGVPPVYERSSVCPVSGTCVPRGVEATVGNTVAAVQVGTTTIPVTQSVTQPGATACVDPIEYALYGMGQVGSGAPLSTDTCWYGPQSFRTPYDAVMVGTGGGNAGSDYYMGLTVAGIGMPLVAVSHGGCAEGIVAVAIGESNRYCNWNGQEAAGLVAVGLLGADGGVAIGGGYGGDGTIAIGGGNAEGVTAISDTGSARAQCIGPIPWGDWECAEPGIAVSGTGYAYGYGHTVSGTGSSDSTWHGYHNDLWPIVSVSGLGNASGGNVAVSGTGSASAQPSTTSRVTGQPVTYPGIAVAGGNANANGGALAVSGTGQAQGGAVNVDSDGVS